eukprot:2597268-Prymnesium_polylepis.1
MVIMVGVVVLKKNQHRVLLCAGRFLSFCWVSGPGREGCSCCWARVWTRCCRAFVCSVELDVPELPVR